MEHIEFSFHWTVLLPFCLWLVGKAFVFIFEYSGPKGGFGKKRLEE